MNIPTAEPLILSYEDASRAVSEYAAIPARHVEPVALLAGLNRVLAKPIIADRDQPPFARSTRDGFACRAADLAATRPLAVIGQLRAGETWPGLPLMRGQAIEIMTGAPVPVGADCVLMIEHATVSGALAIPMRTVQPGENIVPKGAESKAGAVLIAAGTRVGPQHMALAAACGYETISVFAQPRVAILATGDELVPLNQKPLSYQIRNSNSYSLAAQVLRYGGVPVIYPAVRDNLEDSEAAIRSAWDCDLMLLSGGVSMGKYDFVEQALTNLKSEFFFTGARIQPGRPIVFGQLPVNGRNLPFFGLPGNPVSTLVTFTLFAAPLLAALAGETDRGPTFAQGRLTHSLEAKPNLTRFLPASVKSSADGAAICVIPWQGSGDQSAVAKTDCFLVAPPDKVFAEGDILTFLQL